MFFKVTTRFLFFSLSFLIAFSHFSCQDRLESQQVIYSNNFGQLDLRNFENGRLFIFLGDTLLGFYNNEEVSVTIPDLPGHNVLKVEIELWVHDSWDGNPDDGVNGPDFWYMKIDEEEVFRTTFSNTPCMPTFCLRQSYPQDYFRQNNPKAGAIQTNLPGLCLFGAFQNYTTRYRVSRMIPHNTGSVKITLGDELLQTNSPNPLCDESWSVGKIEVTTMVVI
ncbi:hypothetical protein [Cecembia lonarensis]|uniref:Uncharacterized protein n=1 Tax=Cecembia lonarensis (strain CCUG 58316 / KCTC 22772 / LW9) TaxID=1225176 RepID=K1L8A1_CECL9|nr:hypothetical protein [Cecembia lonarensis]EKB48347.1 hypothetical protein B879_03031 [Cecembia lonarensis LW9]